MRESLLMSGNDDWKRVYALVITESQYEEPLKVDGNEKRGGSER